LASIAGLFSTDIGIKIERKRDCTSRLRSEFG
jgi:hypothetical protein